MSSEIPPHSSGLQMPIKAGKVLDVFQIWLFIPCMFDEILISSSSKGNQIKLRRDDAQGLNTDNKKQQNTNEIKFQMQCRIL